QAMEGPPVVKASPPGQRMHSMGSDLFEGIENKPPLEHAGMGHVELRLVNDEIAVEKDVEVDFSWPVANGPNPAQGLFHSLQGRQQPPRLEGRLDFHGAIQVAPLGRTSHRVGLDEPRAPKDPNPWLLYQELQGLLDIFSAVPQVGANTEEDGSPAR